MDMQEIEKHIGLDLEAMRAGIKDGENHVANLEAGAPIAAPEKSELSQQHSAREWARFDLPMVILGERVRGMNLLDFSAFCIGDSPFFCGGEVTFASVVNFLWRLSECYVPEGHTERGEFTKRFAEMNDIEAAAEEVANFVRAHFEAHPDFDPSRPAAVLFVADVVAEVAMATGWSEADITSAPLPTLFQNLQAIRVRRE